MNMNKLTGEIYYSQHETLSLIYIVRFCIGRASKGLGVFPKNMMIFTTSNSLQFLLTSWMVCQKSA